MPLSITKPLELMAKKYFLLYIIKLGLLTPLYSMIKKLYTCKNLLCIVKTNQFSIMLKN